MGGDGKGIQTKHGEVQCARLEHWGNRLQNSQRVLIAWGLQYLRDLWCYSATCLARCSPNKADPAPVLTADPSASYLYSTSRRERRGMQLGGLCLCFCRRNPCSAQKKTRNPVGPGCSTVSGLAQDPPSPAHNPDRTKPGLARIGLTRSGPGPAVDRPSVAMLRRQTHVDVTTMPLGPSFRLSRRLCSP